MDNVKANFEEMMKAVGGPCANIVVNGQLVQGTMTPTMAAINEVRARLRGILDEATEEEIAILLQPVRDILARAAA